MTSQGDLGDKMGFCNGHIIRMMEMMRRSSARGQGRLPRGDMTF